jgi:hypothetical protein
MPINQTFTGKNTGIELPSSQGVQSAQQGLNKLVMDIENIRYETYRKNRDEFLKNSDIDPLFVLSDSARKTQMTLINDFNQKWGKIAKEKNYNFSPEDLMNMQTHKNLVISTAQSQVADMERFKQHLTLAQQHPDRYDATTLAGWADDYNKYGKYEHNEPPLKAIPPGNIIKGLASKYKGGVPKEIIAGTQKGIRYSSFASEQEAEDFAQEVIMSNDQYMLGGLEEWSALPQTTKDAYFTLADENKDKKYSKAEQDNAIMLWMRKRYGKDAMQNTDTGWKNIANEKATTTSEPVEVAGAQVKIFPGKRATNRTYGDQTYSDKSFGFGGNTMLYGIPTKGGKTLEGDYEDVEKGSINGRLVLYDPIKHVFVMEVGAGSESADLKSRVLLEIPESNIQDYQNIPLQLEGGTNTTVALYKKPGTWATPTQTKKTGELDNL